MMKTYQAFVVLTALCAPFAIADAGCQTLAATVAATPELSTLLLVATQAGLVPKLSDPDVEWTVLAPTDDAFGAIPAETTNGLLANTELVTSVLMDHIFEGVVMAADLVDGMELTNLNGNIVTVSLTDGASFTAPDDGETANAVDTDIEACASVVHTIDAVLLSGGATDMLAPMMGPSMAPMMGPSMAPMMGPGMAPMEMEGLAPMEGDAPVEGEPGTRDIALPGGDGAAPEGVEAADASASSTALPAAFASLCLGMFAFAAVLV